MDIMGKSGLKGEPKHLIGSPKSLPVTIVPDVSGGATFMIGDHEVELSIVIKGGDPKESIAIGNQVMRAIVSVGELIHILEEKTKES